MLYPQNHLEYPYMKVKDLKELIKDLPDDMEVLVEGGGGFISACKEDSQVVADGDSADATPMLLISSCLCNEDITLDLSAEDFPEPNLS
jgi:dethiobiotin synthetase